MSAPTADFWLVVASGGAIGAVMRAGAYYAVERLWPYSSRGWLARLGPARATLGANLLGTALLVAGLVFGAGPGSPVGEPFEGFWQAGVCGGLTTFSTLSADAIRLSRAGDHLFMAFYLLVTIALGLAIAQQLGPAGPG